MAKNVEILSIQGPGGAGKDKNIELACEVYPDLFPLSSGDVIRGARKGTGRFAKYDSHFRPHYPAMDAGLILAPEVIIPPMAETLEELALEGHQLIAVSGFPRELVQLLAYDNEIVPAIERHGFQVNTTFVELWVPRPISIQRGLGRGIQAGTAARTDDKEVTLHTRYNEYEQKPAVMAQKLREQGRLVEIDAQPSLDEVFARFNAVVQARRLALMHASNGNGNGKYHQSSEQPIQEMHSR